MQTATTGTAAHAELDASGIESVAIIGFGTMGSGIAHVCAVAGFPVTVVEPVQATIDRDMKTIAKFLDRGVEKGRMTQDDRDAALARISTSTEIEAAYGADLVIEAVTENIDVKRSIFANLDANCAPETILATNTSALSVTEIAAATARPERVVGLHFFNPAPVLPLVEVIRAERTGDDAFDRAFAWVREIAKEPIACGDTPGFVVNRILIPLMNDVVRVLENDTASAEDIDKGCRFGLNWPIGPLALIDLIGLDVHMHASEALYDQYREPRFAAPPTIQRMVKAGKLGRKSGEGFYSYSK